MNFLIGYPDSWYLMDLYSWASIEGSSQPKFFQTIECPNPLISEEVRNTYVKSPHHSQFLDLMGSLLNSVFHHFVTSIFFFFFFEEVLTTFSLAIIVFSNIADIHNLEIGPSMFTD